MDNNLVVRIRKTKAGLFFFILLLLSLTHISCTPYNFAQIKNDFSKEAFRGHYVQNVPFVKQKKNWCGPASLASVLQYWHKDISQEEIAEEIYSPSIEGTLDFDLETFAKKHDLWTRSYEGNIADLRRKVSHDLPVIVLHDEGLGPAHKYHYLVVIGFDDTRMLFIAHSASKENCLIPYSAFRRKWERAGFWALLVLPPEKIPFPLTAEELNELGLFYERKGDLNTAMLKFREAIWQQPRNGIHYYNLANIYLNKGDCKRAIGFYKLALELNQHLADCYNNLAWAYVEEGRNLEEARVYLDMALRLKPENKSYYLDTLGMLHLRQGMREEALASFEEAISSAEDPETTATIRQHMESIE